MLYGDTRSRLRIATESTSQTPEVVWSKIKCLINFLGPFMIRKQILWYSACFISLFLSDCLFQRHQFPKEQVNRVNSLIPFPFVWVAHWQSWELTVCCAVPIALWDLKSLGFLLFQVVIVPSESVVCSVAALWSSSPSLVLRRRAPAFVDTYIRHLLALSRNPVKERGYYHSVYREETEWGKVSDLSMLMGQVTDRAQLCLLSADSKC